MLYKSKLAALALASAITLSPVIPAWAATLVGTTSDATGINSLSVDGSLYDVTFVHDSYDNVYSSTAPFFLGNSTGAGEAATALISALNNLGVTGLTGVDPSFGIQDALIPSSVTATNYSGSGSNLGTSGWVELTLIDISLTQNFGFADQAVFSPAEIPLPTALPLFATGLGAIGLLGWRRKRKAQAI